MTWGIKISKPGYDVKTCTDDQLVMSSEFNAIKVAYSAAPIASGTYTHGLGYAPAFFVSGSFGMTENITQNAFVGQEYSSFEATYSQPLQYFIIIVLAVIFYFIKTHYDGWN